MCLLRRLGIAIGCVIAFALPIGVTAGNRIEFGPPGPPHTIAFDDGIVVASATFRISHDRQHDGGPAGVSPSISSGSLAVRAFGVRRRYDLAAILPIATNRIVLSEAGECGTSTALSRLGSYLVVEAVLAEKGCAPLVALVDLHTGRVAKEAVFDPAWLHRFDVHAFRASGTPIRIVRVERVEARAYRLGFGGAPPTPVTWPLFIIRAADPNGAPRMFVVDPGMESGADERDLALHAGDAAFLGDVDTGDSYVVPKLFSGELFVRPRGAAEARFDALQTPTPETLQAQIRRNHWFGEASERAARGDIAGAVDDFATAVSFHAGGADIDAGDAAMLATCRDLVRRVRTGAVSADVAGRAFSSGCVIPSAGTPRPTPSASR